MILLFLVFCTSELFSESNTLPFYSMQSTVAFLEPILESAGVLTAAVAVFHDVKTNKIPNRLLAGGLLSATVIRAVAALLFSEVFLWENLLKFLLIESAVFLFLWPMFRLKGLGAGDCKLILCLSLFLPYRTIPLFIFTSFVFGAVIGLIKLTMVRMHTDGVPEKDSKDFSDLRHVTILFSVPVSLAYFTIIVFQRLGLI